MLKQKDKSKTYYNLELLRFVFSLSIVYYHLVPTLLQISYNDMLAALQNSGKYIGYLVECFFIMGGYFLYKNHKNNTNLSFLGFAVNRFVRLWPMMFFVNVVLFMFFNQNLENTLTNIFLLKSSGLSLTYQGYDWYVGPFFWASIFIYLILKCFQENKTVLILFVLTYMGYCLNVNVTGGVFGREVVFNFLSLGMYRAISGICFGALIAVQFDSINEEKLVFCRESSGWRVFVTCIELLSGGLFVAYIYGFLYISNLIIVVFLFGIFLTCIISEISYLSELFNKKIFGILGKYSYSIYLCQSVVFRILEKSLWKNDVFIYEHPLWCVALSLVIFTVAGIVAYYLVEVPASIMYNKMEKHLLLNQYDGKGIKVI